MVGSFSSSTNWDGTVPASPKKRTKTSRAKSQTVDERMTAFMKKYALPKPVISLVSAEHSFTLYIDPADKKLKAISSNGKITTLAGM